MPKIKITSSVNGNVTSVKEYDVSDEQAVKVQQFFECLQARKETIRKKIAASPCKDKERGENDECKYPVGTCVLCQQ